MVQNRLCVESTHDLWISHTYRGECVHWQWGFQPRWEERDQHQDLLCLPGFGGGRANGTSCGTWKLGTWKKIHQRMKIAASLMSCGKNCSNDTLVCLLTSHDSRTINVVISLWLLVSTRGNVHAVHGRTFDHLWRFAHKIKIFKMFVESMDRISSNRRNSGIVDFQEAHDEFFGVWFWGPFPQCQSKYVQCNVSSFGQMSFTRFVLQKKQRLYDKAGHTPRKTNMSPEN